MNIEVGGTIIDDKRKYIIIGFKKCDSTDAPLCNCKGFVVTSPDYDRKGCIFSNGKNAILVSYLTYVPPRKPSLYNIL